jgi:hypothetical protein
MYRWVRSHRAVADADLEALMSMEENLTGEPKVISMFARKNSADQSQNADLDHSETAISSFGDVMKKNREVQERLKKERLKANQAVLKSYRIKN